MFYAPLVEKAAEEESFLGEGGGERRAAATALAAFAAFLFAVFCKRSFASSTSSISAC